MTPDEQVQKHLASKEYINCRIHRIKCPREECERRIKRPLEEGITEFEADRRARCKEACPLSIKLALKNGKPIPREHRWISAAMGVQSEKEAVGKGNTAGAEKLCVLCGKRPYKYRKTRICHACYQQQWLKGRAKPEYTPTAPPPTVKADPPVVEKPPVEKTPEAAPVKADVKTKKDVCSVPGCGKRRYAANMCNHHYHEKFPDNEIKLTISLNRGVVLWLKKLGKRSFGRPPEGQAAYILDSLSRGKTPEGLL